MSHHIHPRGPEHTDERSTMESYIIGFGLSLLLTFATYYIVDHRPGMGRATLLTILGLGVLQMVVQILFFLHLGRGPKPFYNIVFFGATVGIILVVVGGSIIIVNNLHSNATPPDQIKKLINDEAIYQIGGAKTGACHGQFQNHTVIINDGQFSPKHTKANKCDTLTFINTDSINQKLLFGTHLAPQSYAGLTEISVRKGLSKTITLSETGTYKLYEHMQTLSTSDFMVGP